MPARLADGLGLESDLGYDYSWPFAPASTCVEDFGSPALVSRKEGQLRLQLHLTLLLSFYRTLRILSMDATVCG